MLNKVILMGNVGRSPHIFLTQEGREGAHFSLATTVVWKAKGGEWQSATDWHQITVFRESTVRWIKDLLKRGDKVYVEGKLAYQHWTDTYNRPRVTAHVVVSGQSGKVEHLRSSKSNSQNHPVKGETEQEVPLSEGPSVHAKEANEEGGEQVFPPLEIPDNDSLSDHSPQDKGETLYEN